VNIPVKPSHLDVMADDALNNIVSTSDKTRYGALGAHARAWERWHNMGRTLQGRDWTADLGSSAARMGAPAAVPPGTGILGKESEPNTTQETRMKPLSIILVTLLVFPLPAWSKDLLLFVIQRSKNANEVHYYLRVDAHCNLASDTPVHALWKLLRIFRKRVFKRLLWNQSLRGKFVVLRLPTS
jgi:hypothetical protein